MSPEDFLLGLYALLLAAAAFIAARWLHARRLLKGLRAPLSGVPLALRAGWSSRSADLSTEREEDAEFSLVEVLYQLSLTDREPVAKWTPSRRPHDLQELLSQFTQVKSPGEDLEFGASRVGEQVLAEELRQLGHDVQLLSPVGQAWRELPGWRAMVDGAEVHVLASLEASEVRAHLKKFSELSVVTLADHADEFLKEQQVIALPQITGDDLNSSAEGVSPSNVLPGLSKEKSEGASSSEDSSGANASLLTLSGLGSMAASQAVSPLWMTAFRSVQLASQGDKRWLSTATNDLADGAASSMGGWAGARAGALAGALLGPMGMAAGGLLGSLLGKKVAEGLATGYKEKELRKLLAEQDELLAKVPSAVCESLLLRAEHLIGVARQLVEFDSVFQLWPTLGPLARLEVAHEYRRVQKSERKRSLGLKRWLRDRHKVATKAVLGRKLLEQGSLGWSTRLMHLRSELTRLGAQIEAESRRLGPSQSSN